MINVLWIYVKKPQESPLSDSSDENRTYTYGLDGRVAWVTYPSTRTLDYTRDGLGRIESLSTTYNAITKDLATGLTYRPFGGPKGMTNGSGGVVSNQAGECDCVTVSNPGQARERTYGYDDNRNLTSITGTNTPWYSQTFGYDELNRLMSATGRYGTIGYTYDDVGNRLTRNTNGVSETCTYVTGTNKIDEITGGPNQRTFAYDGNGNITGDGTLTFIYDQTNQLKEVKDGEGVNTIATYTYNGLGERAIKAASGVMEVYHYDLDGKLIAESTLAGTFTKEYLYMGKVRVAMVDVAGGGTVYAYQNDRLGTPELLTTRIGDNETVVWEAWYEPFGEGHIHPSSSVVNNIRLPGQYYDSETGLHYNYHRYYDPKTERYITPDPIGLRGGINLFAYVTNNPANSIDFWGLVELNLISQNERLHSYMDAIPKSVFFTVGAHGTPFYIVDQSGQPMSPADLGNRIKNSPKYTNGQMVELISCETGSDQGTFAQDLANALGVPVLAPDKVIWVYSTGSTVVAPVDPTNPNVPEMRDQGRTKVFLPLRSIAAPF